MAKLYSVIYVGPIDEFLTKAVDTVMGRVGDWIRITHNAWFVWTDLSSAGITQTLRHEVASNSQFVVTAVEPQQATGFSAPWVWDWLNRRMSEQAQPRLPGPFPDILPKKALPTSSGA